MKKILALLIISAFSYNANAQDGQTQVFEFQDLRYNNISVFDWKIDQTPEQHTISKYEIKDARIRTDWKIVLNSDFSQAVDAATILEEGEEEIGGRKIPYHLRKEGETWIKSHFVTVGDKTYHISYTATSPYGKDSSTPFDKYKKSYKNFLAGLLFPGEDIPKDVAEKIKLEKFHQAKHEKATASSSVGKKLPIDVPNPFAEWPWAKWRLSGRGYKHGFVIEPHKETGFVVIKIKVDRSGSVVLAENTEYSTTISADLIAIAKKAAMNLRFNGDSAAAEKQSGFLTFDFKLQ